ncbi:ABC transporter ATP-binding protein [Actinomyces sp. B33]|uniref:ABC transporter ATP-binding protein n=1 Tax=Actinomyces sp. B33 TaxID=2942131 RepID=UPI0023410F33|nr:ABC transporter ATP-binding protein [Actinomyces sp. B33]MDC4232556.1 ABC transporter ATP-binding protein [Actinomyces sp. B33]
MATVVFENVSKVFPSSKKGEGVMAVRDLNLIVEEGELLTLLGPSGCGKTTILRMLAGFEPVTDGKIFLDGVDITSKPVNTRGIGMVFQSYALFPHMSVYDNVAYGLMIEKLSKKEIEKRVSDVMDLMAISQFADRAPNQLSGGQQQRVALARAVVTEPSVLLLDEPLSNLDAQLREQMRDELRRIQQRLGITSLYVTHDQSEALAISDEVILLRDGIIQQRGSAEYIYQYPDSEFVAQFLGKASILSGKLIGQYSNGGEVLIDGMVGKIFQPIDESRMGMPVKCVVRPENVAFNASPEGKYVIEQAVFQGLYVEYRMTIGGERFAIVDHDYLKNGALSAGDRIDIELERTPLWILPEAKDKVNAF